MDRLDEGYIKFRLLWTSDKAPSGTGALVHWRNKLYQAGLIGAYPSGIGFGNISLRREDGFLISGSGTGSHATASAEHFTRVTAYSIDDNTVYCRGPVKASSESLTHAAIYEAAPAVMAIAHVHHRGIWESLLGKAQMTAPGAPYGTPEMAREIFRLFRETEVEAHRFFLMAGHEEGLVGFGASPAEASRILLRLLREWRETGHGAPQSR